MQAGREGGSGPALWALTICTGHIASVQPRQPTVQTVGSFGLSPSSGTTCSLTLNEAIVPPRTSVREKMGRRSQVHHLCTALYICGLCLLAFISVTSHSSG